MAKKITKKEEVIKPFYQLNQEWRVFISMRDLTKKAQDFDQAEVWEGLATKAEMAMLSGNYTNEPDPLLAEQEKQRKESMQKVSEFIAKQKERLNIK